MLKENRSMLVVILLSIITCGLYSLWFYYAYARDMNTACAGDGKKTGGLLAIIFLSIITLGIYGIVWTYKVGDRIYENCARRGLQAPCSGGSLLLWSILGSAIIIGPFVALHKMLKGLNMLCAHYNRAGRGGVNVHVTVN